MTTLKEKLIECLPEEKYIEEYETGKGARQDKGYNKCLSDIKLHSIDKMMEVMREEIKEVIQKDYSDEYKISGEFGEKRIDTELYRKIMNLLSTPNKEE